MGVSDVATDRVVSIELQLCVSQGFVLLLLWCWMLGVGLHTGCNTVTILASQHDEWLTLGYPPLFSVVGGATERVQRSRTHTLLGLHVETDRQCRLELHRQSSLAQRRPHRAAQTLCDAGLPWLCEVDVMIGA